MHEHLEDEVVLAARETAAANIADRKEAVAHRIASAGNLRALSGHAAESFNEFEVKEGHADPEIATAHDKRIQHDIRVHDRVIKLMGRGSLSRSR